MNRIKLGPLATMSPATRREPDAQSRVWESRSVLDEHSVFVPLHYEKNYAYPLVVWLHDRAADESVLVDVMPHLSLRNYVAVAPRGVDLAAGGGFEWRQSLASIELCDRAVAAAIDDARARLNISSSRVFIGGEGSGGSMAFRMGFRRPEWFAGVLSLNGELPSGFNPLARLNACRRLPVFWTQCRQQSPFDETTLGQNLRLLHSAGFNLTLRQYPAGDQRAGMLADANRWIMDLITRPAQASA